MAVRAHVRRREQFIGPVRFVRAVTGAPVADAPDVDDRGFGMGTRPGTWGSSNARGAMVGITKGDTVRVKVDRVDIDAAAPLYLTSTDTAVAAVAAPAGGGPLPADGVFSVRGVEDFKNRPVKIQVHLGAADGPVLGELEPHIFTERRVRVRVHRCTINGTAVMHGGGAIPATTGLSPEDIDAMFAVANAIWRPVGVRFRIVSRRNTTVTLAARTTHITQSLQGCIAIDNSNNWTAQYDELLQTNRMVGTINVYFVRRIWNTQDANGGGTMGIGTTVTARNSYGVALADGADENDLAHELGHVLNLDFHAGGSIGHADDTAAGSNTRDTIWTRRRLMYAFNPAGFAGDGSPAYLTDVGYGAYARGSLITVKNTTGDATDGETAEARRRARSLP